MDHGNNHMLRVRARPNLLIAHCAPSGARRLGELRRRSCGPRGSSPAQLRLTGRGQLSRPRRAAWRPPGRQSAPKSASYDTLGARQGSLTVALHESRPLPIERQDPRSYGPIRSLTPLSHCSQRRPPVDWRNVPELAAESEFTANLRAAPPPQRSFPSIWPERPCKLTFEILSAGSPIVKVGSPSGRRQQSSTWFFENPFKGRQCSHWSSSHLSPAPSTPEKRTN